MGKKNTKFELCRCVEKENMDTYNDYPCCLVRVVKNNYKDIMSVYIKMENIPNIVDITYAMNQVAWDSRPWGDNPEIYSITKLDSQDYIPDINELWIYNEYSYEKPDKLLPDTEALKNRITELEKEISEVKQNSHRHKTGAERAAEYKARWKARM